MKFYKIKVGIEEYPVKEADIERIVSAMKTNDMVKLDCGIFRGQAILAVCEDFNEEKRQMMLSMMGSSGRTRSEDEIREEIIEKQRGECTRCNHTGWIFVDRNGEKVAQYCTCTVIRSEVKVISEAVNDLADKLKIK